MLPEKPKSTSYRDYEAKGAFPGQNIKGVDRAAAEARLVLLRAQELYMRAVAPPVQGD